MRNWGWRRREDEERSGRWPLGSPRLCSCRMTQPWEGGFCPLVLFCCVNIPGNKWPKEKARRNRDCLWTASRTHKMLRNTLEILTCFFLFPPPLRANSLILPFHSASLPTHSFVFIWNIKFKALPVRGCVGGSLITLKYLVYWKRFTHQGIILNIQVAWRVIYFFLKTASAC